MASKKYDKAITRSCAQRDWHLQTSEEVLSNNSSHALINYFLKNNLESFNVINRKRDVPKGKRPPGQSELRKVKTQGKGYRALVWADNGSKVYNQSIGNPVIWMISFGIRREDSRSDFYKKFKGLIEDPLDVWIPTEDDYADLSNIRKDLWIKEVREEIRHSVSKASEDVSKIIPISLSPELDQIKACVYYDSISYEGIMKETLSERWFIISKRYNKEPQEMMPKSLAYVLASAAFEDCELDNWGLTSLPNITGLEYEDHEVFCFVGELS